MTGHEAAAERARAILEEIQAGVFEGSTLDGQLNELGDAIDALAAALSAAQDALRAEIERVCECGGEDHGEGIGVGVIDSERSRFDYGADAYNGAGDVIVDYFDCPCVPLRAALASADTETP